MVSDEVVRKVINNERFHFSRRLLFVEEIPVSHETLSGPPGFPNTGVLGVWFTLQSAVRGETIHTYVYVALICSGARRNRQKRVCDRFPIQSRAEKRKINMPGKLLLSLGQFGKHNSASALTSLISTIFFQSVSYRGGKARSCSHSHWRRSHTCTETHSHTRACNTYYTYMHMSMQTRGGLE